MILLCKGANFSLCCGLFIPGVKICTKNVSQVNQAEQHHSGVILKNYSYYVTFSIPDHCLARISMLSSMVHEEGPLEQDDLKCTTFGIFQQLSHKHDQSLQIEIEFYHQSRHLGQVQGSQLDQDKKFCTVNYGVTSVIASNVHHVRT